MPRSRSVAPRSRLAPTTVGCSRCASGTAVAIAIAMVGPRVAPASAQALETETARVLPSGMVEAGLGVELQGSSEGTETAAPLFAEIGIADRFELVVEQVAFTRIKQTGSMT